jgi:hypothetical protein
VGYAQTQFEAVIMEVFGRTLAIIGLGLETAVAVTAGVATDG